MMQNNGNIGNAVRELAPNTTWKLHGSGTELSDLEWLDDSDLRPSSDAILAKVAELDSLSEANTELSARETALAKLSALGLTEAEIKALLG